MTVALPEILSDPQYKDQWTLDGWKPIAKPGAPQALKTELRRWAREIEAEERNLRRSLEPLPEAQSPVLPSYAHICPVCGKYTFEKYNSFEICPVCGWMDDVVQEKGPGLHRRSQRHERE